MLRRARDVHRSHDEGTANTVTAHQPLNATAAHAAPLMLQFNMDTRTAIASMVVAMDPFDIVQQGPVGDGSPALRT